LGCIPSLRRHSASARPITRRRGGPPTNIEVSQSIEQAFRRLSRLEDDAVADDALADWARFLNRWGPEPFCTFGACSA
jgi:hypothetical protein